mmetsp:Transcript_5599/g.11878  ORF Transcript_5599/g.11878 Transcript_5599/m.11878 type:complete len:228 (+) Transcript_5599:156-839(+)|eukprot:CAMPEP_0201118636 /NCGR_PEP_ID=MMETSP0850-20130426/2828_1 /ASSEMBLY_ACC=CAM_ASM_000622 /TAXON_ID=183588 /ORGANISM="Pseudo-nitzschia fraudulenta, Strain WWA7" /LENGTH=227 /DNA_ID=CAMNT_0047383977 /DNA_START=134 /DNA_END=817 /DNA_ORIENTATION=-
MGVVQFVRHVWKRIEKPLSSNNQDVGVAIALYAVYPAILWLLIDKFHGICGYESYAIKAEAIAANNSVFLWFTALMRTNKIATILLFQADANDKREDDDEERQEVGDDDDDDDEEEGCTRLKCRVWFMLSQELTAIVCVAVLLILCLPVLAFWFMLIGCFVSLYKIYQLLKRLWRDAHNDDALASSGYDEDVSILDASMADEVDSDEIEFQEFLSNFVDDDGFDDQS